MFFCHDMADMTTQNELLRVARSVLRQKFHMPFTETPKLHSCSVLKISDKQGSVEHHGKLCVEPDSAAEWFIKHIKEKTLHSKRLLARQFFHRDSNNRRSRATNPEDERRRQDLKVIRLKPIKPTFIEEGMDSFRAEHRD